MNREQAETLVNRLIDYSEAHQRYLSQSIDARDDSHITHNERIKSNVELASSKKEAAKFQIILELTSPKKT